MERNKIKEEEIKFLANEFKKNPELFGRETFIDSSNFLEKIGISFEKNSILIKGYLKLWPQDFIVEEILQNKEIQTINLEEIFSQDKNFSKEDLTTYATLVKCKLPTFEATKELASYLNIDKEKIQFAGIKDTDAITSQLISIRWASDIDKLKNFKSAHFFLKNLYTGKGVVETGSLYGNKFTILIRTQEDINQEEFNLKIEKIKREGFYNFFYSQRFASPRFINWFWGLCILRGEYRSAVLSFLSSEGQRESEYFKNIRKEIANNFENWDKIEKLIEPFPIIFQNELKILKYLKANPKDFIGALQQIPEQVQLWIFGYNSLLFNRKVSEYIYNDKLLPEKLPLPLSLDKNDWLVYYDYLKEDQIFSMPYENLKPFPNIQWKKRLIKTKEFADIYDIKFVPEGVVLSFSLPKGCYATTFLAHLFELETGFPPENISKKIIDIKEVLGEKSITKVFEKFKEVTFSKSEDFFEKLSE